MASGSFESAWGAQVDLPRKDTPIQPPRLTSRRTGRITPKNSEVDRGDALGLSGEACAACGAAMRLAPVSNALRGSECSHFAATPPERLLLGRQKPRICGAFSKRMMGLEPTTFCMASAGGRSCRFAPVRPHCLFAGVSVRAGERDRT